MNSDWAEILRSCSSHQEAHLKWSDRTLHTRANERTITKIKAIQVDNTQITLLKPRVYPPLKNQANTHT